MNNVCPNCGILGPNFSCHNHVTYWGINPLPDSIPFPQHGGITLTPPVNAELFAEIGRLNVLLNERDKEIGVLKGIIEDLQKKGVLDKHCRPLPLEGHKEGCAHGKNGWGYCSCEEPPTKESTSGWVTCDQDARGNLQYRCNTCGYVTDWVGDYSEFEVEKGIHSILCK